MRNEVEHQDSEARRRVYLSSLDEEGNCGQSGAVFRTVVGVLFEQDNGVVARASEAAGELSAGVAAGDEGEVLVLRLVNPSVVRLVSPSVVDVPAELMIASVSLSA